MVGKRIVQVACGDDFTLAATAGEKFIDNVFISAMNTAIESVTSIIQEPFQAETEVKSLSISGCMIILPDEYRTQRGSFHLATRVLFNPSGLSCHFLQLGYHLFNAA